MIPPSSLGGATPEAALATAIGALHAWGNLVDILVEAAQAYGVPADVLEKVLDELDARNQARIDQPQTAMLLDEFLASTRASLLDRE